MEGRSVAPRLYPCVTRRTSSTVVTPARTCRSPSSLSDPRRPSSRSSRRTTLSPWSVGMVETRTSTPALHAGLHLPQGRPHRGPPPRPRRGAHGRVAGRRGGGRRGRGWLRGHRVSRCQGEVRARGPPGELRRLPAAPARSVLALRGWRVPPLSSWRSPSPGASGRRHRRPRRSRRWSQSTRWRRAKHQRRWAQGSNR